MDRATSPVRQMVWLKVKLQLRGFSRSPAAIISTIMLVAIFGPISGGLAAGLWFTLTHLAPVYGSEFLEGILTVIFVLWQIAPLIGFALSDTYDVTRLFTYPLSYQQILAGVTLSTLLDVSTLFLLPALVVVWWHFTSSLLASVIVAVALAMLVCTMLLLSQTLVLFSAGALRSRRYRDLATLLVLLISAGFYILMHTLGDFLVRGVTNIKWAVVAHSPVWFVLHILPSGAAVQAIRSATEGNLLMAFLWLALLGLYMAIILRGAAWLIEEVYHGGEVGLKASVPTETSAITQAPTRENTFMNGLYSRLPVETSAVLQKDLRYFMRNPYHRLILANMAYIAVVMLWAIHSIHNSPTDGFSGGITLSMSFTMLLTQTTLINNQLGMEAMVTLLLTPAARVNILLGKNIAIALVFAPIGMAILASVCIFTGDYPLIMPLMLWQFLGLITLLAVGNFISILVPYPVVLRGMKVSGASGRGFLQFIIALLSLLLSTVLLAPVGLMLILPAFMHLSAWVIPGAVGSMLYAFVFYGLSIKYAGRLFQEREQDVLAKMTRQKE